MTCGRSFRVDVEHHAGGLRFEFVQTGGEDLPGWYEPKMRRVPPR